MMKSLLAWMMQGRTQAILATLISVCSALVLSPMLIASAAIIALATLRNGMREGLWVLVASLLSLALLGGVLSVSPWALLLPASWLWLSAWSSGWLLRRGRSLAGTLEPAMIGAWLLVGLQFLALDAPVEFWRGLINSLLKTQFDALLLQPEQQQVLVTALATWMPGAIAASWFVLNSSALLLALWAEATLRETHDFARAFQSLRFSRSWLIIAPLLLIPALLSEDTSAGLPSQLYLVMIVLFVLQALSLGHYLARHFQIKRFWLTGSYVLLVLGMPFSLNIASLAGYLDGWWDFRTRLQARTNSHNDK
ncbi:MAG: hypothetical protein AAFO08_00620 [Pseudomonadota bacterium]